MHVLLKENFRKYANIEQMSFEPQRLSSSQFQEVPPQVLKNIVLNEYVCETLYVHL